ncbi:MTSS1-like protein [Acanthaster planci]|uniref:MTSS1-like protein n=1 Tax=Acanthaster planci TaxID=133434 RepID=A0A8B7XNR8_ACAPL|nr:MTSS1-like protein [Acanthaster planci]
MEVNAERDCSVLGGLFQTIINDMKGSVPVWEDFTSKASKLHTQLKTTIVAVSAFLEAFQRIADIATNSRGATKDLGASLTRMCIRHKTIELKLKSFTNAIMECLVNPLQERMEDWKKITTQLDKEHAKDYKKARQDIKKKSSDTVRLQKKARKGKADIQYRLDSAMHDVNDMYLLLEEQEKNAVRGGMIEERSRFCMLINCFKPVVDEEISMLSEVTRLESVLGELVEHSKDPYILPPSSEQVIMDIKGQEIKLAYQTPPGSPSPSSGSRKSSMCSLSSMTSSDSRSSSSTNSHSPGANFVRHRSLSQPNSAYRLSSVSSQDSGFTSQDMLFPAQPGTPPQTVPEETAQQRLLHCASTPYELEHQSSSECSTPSSPTPPPTASQFTIPPSQAPPPPSWLVNFSQSEKLQRPKSIPTPLVPSGTRPPPPPVADKPLVSPKPKTGDAKAGSTPFVPDFNTPQSNQIVPRPLCASGQPLSNADLYRQRSATLPARRHTHSSMPSALYSLDSDGTTSSHGSLSTSSGYSTQSTTGTNSDEMLTLQDRRHHSLEDSMENVTDNEKPPVHSFQATESVYTTTPNHSPTRRPMSMSCMPTASLGEPAIRGTTTTPSGSLRKSKPPPPIRRTPSGGSLAGMSITPEAQGAVGEGPDDAYFKRPYTPGRVRSQSTVQAPYGGEAQQSGGGSQGRVHRSHSLKLAGDVVAGDLARMNLMESLNAKLAKRGTAQPQQDAGPRQQMQAEHYAQPMQQQQQSTQQYQQSAQQYQQSTQHYQQQSTQHYQQQSTQHYQQQSTQHYQQQQSTQQYKQQPGQYQQQQQQQQTHQYQQQHFQQNQYQQQQQQPQHNGQQQGLPSQRYSQPHGAYKPPNLPPPQQQQQAYSTPSFQQVQQQLQQQLQHGAPLQPSQYGGQPSHGHSQITSQSGNQGDSDSSDSDEGVGILAEIKRGVKLRRTISNDRSAPRI